MDKDEAIKNNRLSQMRFLTDIFTKMADLNQIEDKKIRGMAKIIPFL